MRKYLKISEALTADEPSLNGAPMETMGTSLLVRRSRRLLQGPDVGEVKLKEDSHVEELHCFYCKTQVDS